MSQCDEIEESAALTWFGVALGLSHVLLFHSWNGGDYPARFIFATSSNMNPVCWPILPGCARWRLLGDPGVLWVARAYLLSGVVAMIGFATKRVSVGWTALGFALILQTYFYLHDYRFGAENAYFLAVLTVVYLLVPGKVGALRGLIVAYYVGAGLSHLSSAFVSGEGVGSALTQRGIMKWAWDHGLWSPAAAYVAFLTAVLSFGLLVEREALFWSTLVQLALLHLVTRPIEGWTGTAMHLLWLGLFPLAKLLDGEERWYSPPAAVVLLVYAALQIWPWVTPGDHLLTGEGRLGAITAYDGTRTCRSNVIGQFDHHAVDLSADNEASPQWLDCDPYFKLRRLQGTCAALRADPAFRSLAWQMNSRRGSAGAFRSVVRLDDVCRGDVKYNWLGFNTWITR